MWIHSVGGVFDVGAFMHASAAGGWAKRHMEPDGGLLHNLEESLMARDWSGETSLSARMSYQCKALIFDYIT